MRDTMRLVVRNLTLLKFIAITILCVSLTNFVAFDLSAQSAAAAHSEDHGDDEVDCHDCFACCGHLVTTVVQSLLVPFADVTSVDFCPPGFPTSRTFPFFHPPRA